MLPDAAGNPDVFKQANTAGILSTLGEIKTEEKQDKTKLELSNTPAAWYECNKDKSHKIPDGVGLQILFQTGEKEYHMVVGTWRGKINTVNGGKIEDPEKTFFTDCARELEEETFGCMKLLWTKEDGYQLLLNGRKHKLSLQEKGTDLEVKNEKDRNYSYVTFTAICSTVPLDELKQLAVSMTPTAHFWNQLGNYLHTTAPSDNARDRRKTVNGFLGDSMGKKLLITPAKVFDKEDDRTALFQLPEMGSGEDFKLFRERVGNYSERPAYHLLNASSILSAANATIAKIVVTDVATNKLLETKGVCTSNAVKKAFPDILGIKAEKSGMVEGRASTQGQFQPPSTKPTLPTTPPPPPPLVLDPMTPMRRQ